MALIAVVAVATLGFANAAFAANTGSIAVWHTPMVLERLVVDDDPRRSPADDRLDCADQHLRAGRLRRRTDCACRHGHRHRRRDGTRT